MFRDRGSTVAAGLVAVAAILWGLWPSVLRPGGLPALQCALVVQTVQALPAMAMAWRERNAFRDRGAVVALALFGAFDAAQCALYFPALTRGPVAVAALTHYLGPILVALAAPFVPGERTSRRAMLAAPLSLLGLLLVLGRPRHAPVLTAVLGGGSAFFGAACLFAVRRARARARRDDHLPRARHGGGRRRPLPRRAARRLGCPGDRRGDRRGRVGGVRAAAGTVGRAGPGAAERRLAGQCPMPHSPPPNTYTPAISPPTSVQPPSVVRQTFPPSDWRANPPTPK